MAGRIAFDWDSYRKDFELAAQKVRERINGAPIKIEIKWVCNCGQNHIGQVPIGSEEELQLSLFRYSSQPGVQILNIWRNENGIR